MDEVFKALADASRRQLLDSLNNRNGQTLRELSAELAMTRQSVSKHLAVLESANLVTTTRRGREKLHYLNAMPINAIADRWINHYHRERARTLADLKTALEEEPMTENAFVYTTYINTTPQKLWQALTDPAFTDRYWGASLESDWRKGSEVAWSYKGTRVADPEQVVLESDPYQRLSYTWHTFTPEMVATLEFDAQFAARVSAEQRSKVAFTIEEVAQGVKLTVVHDGFGPDSALLTGISTGWPVILSNLKTLLETGNLLPSG